MPHGYCEAVGLQKGDQVADIGAGTGLFAMLFADEVGPQGWVFAIEIAPRFVERIGELADQRGLAHVTPLHGTENAVRLPADSIDVAFVSDTYHHFELPHSMLAFIKRALRPGGRLIIVDFERIPGVSREWTMDHVRAGKPKVSAEVEAAKFEFLGETSIAGLQENYFMTFRNPTE